MAYGKYGGVAVRMLRWLMANDIKGGPVSQPSTKDPTVVVYGMTKASLKKLPKTFEGYAVEGTSKQPNYDRNLLTDLLRESAAVRSGEGEKQG